MNQEPDNYEDRQNGRVVGWLFLAVVGVLAVCAIMILIELTTA
jgi:hypothetical protein